MWGARGLEREQTEVSEMPPRAFFALRLHAASATAGTVPALLAARTEGLFVSACRLALPRGAGCQELCNLPTTSSQQQHSLPALRTLQPAAKSRQDNLAS